MQNFYTNVQCAGNFILFRGIVNGKRISKRMEYEPRLYEPSNKPTPFKTIHGEYLHEFKFDSIREARDYVKQNENVANKKIFGNAKYEYCYIADNYVGDVDWDQSLINIAYIDIEVGSENGFPKPEEASEPITAICLKYSRGHTWAFGCGDYETKGDEIYVKCKDEYTLCKKFLEVWTENYPDIISGWNIKFFDFPYLINRFKKLLSEENVRRLSPWNYIQTRTTVLMAKEHTVYDMVGIAMLDYLELYRKYAQGGASQESYKLDSIASVELGKNKISYDEYDSLHQLYRLNYQKFIEYNIQDTNLVEELESELNLIQLALTLAYDSKTNYDDVFTQVRMWDTLIFNHLLKDNIMMPPNTKHDKDAAYEGAYVKDPITGFHNCVASFDLDSLYPHLIMQYNVSPDMIVEPDDYDDDMRDIISQGISVERLLDKKIDTSKLRNKKVTFAPNSQFFRTDKQGFLSKMMETMYEDRKVYKKKAIEAKKELEKETDPTKHFGIEKKIARFNNLQLAKKVCLNSAYGALGNEFFRFFDVRQASAITFAGQLSIRWIEKKLNEYMVNLLKVESDYVIASDTDSIYMNLGPLAQKVYGDKLPGSKVIDFMDRVCEDKIKPYIDKSYQELADYMNAYAQKMRMKRESLADKGIFCAKKRYILNVYDNEGVRYNEPSIKVMGLEMVKSSTPAPIREQMKQIIKVILNGTEDDVHKFIDAFKIEFNKLEPEDISFPRGVRGIEKYSNPVTLYSKGTPIHVKGAIIYNNTLKQMKLEKQYPAINDGEKIKFTYLKMPNPFKETVISFPVRLPKEFDLRKYVDYDTQFNKSFIEPIKIILDSIGWNIVKTNTLEDFFS
jgi:DNA polymerase elongation subunit (family B)